MAYSTCTCDLKPLRDAILRVWRPVVGARSHIEILQRNAQEINNLHGFSNFARFMLLDNVPFHFSFLHAKDYSDDYPPFQIKKEVLSGSWSEGLYFYGQKKIKNPDMDYMLILKNLSFSRDDQRSGNLTLKEDTPFVYAYITDEDAVKMWHDFLVDNMDAPKRRLSSKKLKKKLYRNYKKLPLNSEDELCGVDEGPAMYINRNEYAPPPLKWASNILTNLFSSHLTAQSSISKLQNAVSFTYSNGLDIVLAISCEGWPSCAREWIARDRVWPHEDLVEKIIRDGFHVVPKSSAEGDFRLSFSFAETTLIENLTELQHKVLRSFKAVVKYHQSKWSPNTKKLITTYHLKTIAFWYFEKTAQESFGEEDVAICLTLLLQDLADALRIRELPMYFMPKVNLFRNIEIPEEAIDISEKIRSLSNNFPLLIEALDNITFCFGRLGAVMTNQMENNRNLDKENISLILDDTQDFFKRYINPAKVQNFPPRSTTTRPESNSDLCMVNKGDFIDLD